MRRYYIESKTKKDVKGYGYFSFRRNLSKNMENNY